MVEAALGPAVHLWGLSLGGVELARRRLQRQRANEHVAASKGYDYVEAMACPSGCVNGDGQLKPLTSSFRASSQAIEEGYSRHWEASGVVQYSSSGSPLEQEPDMRAGLA